MLADNPLIDRLRRQTDLRDAELDVINGLCGQPRLVFAGRALVGEGSDCASIHVLLDGWAVRQKMRDNGGRQITAIILPGDLCDLDVLHVGTASYGVCAITDCIVSTISVARLRKAMADNPAISRALAFLAGVETATLMMWLTMLGRARAQERLAHILCELRVRLTRAGLMSGNAFTLPLTQEELGDATGLTAVHVNRTLSGMKQRGLIESVGRTLNIPHPGKLEQAAGFTASHLYAGDPVTDAPGGSHEAPLRNLDGARPNHSPRPRNLALVRSHGRPAGG